MRYTVITEPTRPEALPALMPQMLTAPGSRATFWGGANVIGAPGTNPVYSPRPSAMVDGSWGGLNQPSACAPDYIMPNQYQSVPSNMWSHVRTQSDNQMPVPAMNLYNMPGIAMHSQHVGGQQQVTQPQATQYWPDLNSGALPPSAGNAGWKFGGS